MNAWGGCLPNESLPCTEHTQGMYEMLAEYGGKIPPTDQVVLDDTKEVGGLMILVLLW